MPAAKEVNANDIQKEHYGGGGPARHEVGSGVIDEFRIAVVYRQSQAIESRRTIEK